MCQVIYYYINKLKNREEVFDITGRFLLRYAKYRKVIMKQGNLQYHFRYAHHVRCSDFIQIFVFLQCTVFCK